MRTTVRLEDELLEEARRVARERGETLTAFIDRALRLLLAEVQENGMQKEKVSLPVSKARGGTLPGVDLNRHSELLDLMDED